MIENNWTLDAGDGHRIYGATAQADSVRANRAIILVHGMTCNRLTHPFPLYMLAALEAGFDVISFNIYGDAAGARNGFDCDVEVFARYFRAVFNASAAKYQMLFATGHSYGGTAIMIANPGGLRAATLLDPAYNPAGDDTEGPGWADQVWRESGDHYEFVWGNIYKFAPAVREAEMQYDTQKCRELARNAAFPVQELASENYREAPAGELFHTYCSRETDFLYYPDATHFFERLDQARDISRRSLAWFARFTP